MGKPLAKHISRVTPATLPPMWPCPCPSLQNMTVDFPYIHLPPSLINLFSEVLVLCYLNHPQWSIRPVCQQVINVSLILLAKYDEKPGSTSGTKRVLFNYINGQLEGEGCLNRG